jgi:hypothetical protein
MKYKKWLSHYSKNAWVTVERDEILEIADEIYKMMS